MRARRSGRTPLSPASAREAVLIETPHCCAMSSSRTRLLSFPRLPVVSHRLAPFGVSMQKIFRLRKFSFCFISFSNAFREEAWCLPQTKYCAPVLICWSPASPAFVTQAPFSEPNLDGTAGDYISFDAWEWPQGVGLYGLVRLWQITRRQQRCAAASKHWYARHARDGPAAAQCQHHRADAGLSMLWAKTRDPRWTAGARRLGEPRDQSKRRARRRRLPARRLRQDQRRRTLGRHAVHGGTVPGLLWRRRGPARTGRRG